VALAGDAASALQLKRGAESVQVSAVSQNNPNTTVTLSFSGPLTQFGSLIDGDYQLRALANQVTGAGPLDGNNDGFGGDDYTFNFHRLFGDVNGDRDVDAADFLAFRGAFLGITPYNPALDFDGNGSVDMLGFLPF